MQRQVQEFFRTKKKWINMLNFLGLIVFFYILGVSGQDSMDCSKPPPFVNPHSCCKDPPPSEIAQVCSEKTKVPLRMDRAPAMGQENDIGAVTCFAECVLTESKYLKNGQLDMDTIKGDLKKKFTKDPDYIPVMEQAFTKCGPVAQRYLAMAQNAPSPPPPAGSTKACSPLSGIILGCAYKEFFENCPASKWTSNDDCNAVQKYIKKCSKV